LTANEKGLQSLSDQISRENSQRALANNEGLASLAEEMRRHGKSRTGRHRSGTKSRRWRRTRRGFVIGLAVLLVVAGGGAGYAYYLAHSLNRVEVKGLNGLLTTGAEAGSENILMVGSTSRCALKVQNAAYGLCQGTAGSAPVNGVNSDIIMILHVNPANHHLSLLSIPRDLFIPNARVPDLAQGITAGNKIDAGLYQGITQLVAAIEEDFGIPIQHAVSLNFDSFASVVDALGGVDMNFPMSVFDWSPTGSSGLNVQAAACVHLNGTQALEMVRSRELRYQASGVSAADPSTWPIDTGYDLSRIRRTHEFLKVLATGVSKRGLGNPISDLSLINAVKGDLSFDQSWAVNEMVSLVLEFHNVDINSAPQLTLPVSVGPNTSYTYEGIPGYGDIEFPSEAQDQAAIDQVLGIGASTDSMTGNPLPAPSSVTVSVQNGSGAYNQATATATALQALGFRTVGVGDSTPVSTASETVVYYGSRTAAAEAAAEAVVRSMTGAVILGYDPTMVADGAQVTVVTGTQFAVNPPTAGSTATAVTPGSGSSAAGSPVTTASGFAPPTATTQKLQPWDPRVCAPGANPTLPVPNPLPPAP
jgi:LCP family protein required for cell wall assembly